MRPKWTFSIDLDGILCESGPPDKYPVARPIKETISKINALYEKGYNIVVHTGRSWGSYDLTKAWLVKNGVKHTELVMGKVVAHYYIDDRNANLEDVVRKFLTEDETEKEEFHGSM